MARVGVLALQGAFKPHLAMLSSLGHEAVEVRAPMEGIQALVLPGGESTVQRRLMQRAGLWPWVKALIASGTPVLGTCAGLILLSRRIEGSDEETLNALDVTVRRNAYGRQIASFEAVVELEREPMPVAFIRAPRVERIGAAVTVLSELNGEAVCVRQGNAFAASFHSELTFHNRLHRLFLANLGV